MIRRALLPLATFAFAIILPAQTRPFPVFENSGFTNKPDLTPFGIKPITVAYPPLIWTSWTSASKSDKETMPDKAKIAAIAQKAQQSSGILVFDIEHWPLAGDPATVNASLSKYKTLIQWAKAAVPSLKVGFYGAVVRRDYWAPVQGAKLPRFTSWQRGNDTTSSLGQAVDIVFPSLYTFYDDQAGWQTYAIAQIQEARRVAPGKPVYVFLWPQFLDTNKGKGGMFIPPDYWKMELDTAKKYADGAVIWCCSSPQAWNDEAPWWIATQDFLKENTRH